MRTARAAGASPGSQPSSPARENVDDEIGRGGGENDREYPARCFAVPHQDPDKEHRCRREVDADVVVVRSLDEIRRVRCEPLDSRFVPGSHAQENTGLRNRSHARDTRDKRRTNVKRLALSLAAAFVVLTACQEPIDSTGVVGDAASEPSASAQVSPSPDVTSEGEETARYVAQFRRDFDQVAEGRTDQQIIQDALDSCSDMAAAMDITTPSMRQRYGLSESTVDQFTLHNIALLTMAHMCQKT